MTTAVTSLLERFGVLMNDVGAVRWPNAERLIWLNEGQRELVRLKDDANTKVAVMNMAIGARQALSGATDCHKVIGVRAGGTNRAVLPCERAVLDAFDPGWMAQASTDPVIHWMPDESPTAIWVYPSQSAAGGQLLITYVAYPPEATLADNLGVRDGYASNILNYMLYRAYSKDAEFGGNASLASAAYTLFAE